MELETEGRDLDQEMIIDPLRRRLESPRDQQDLEGESLARKPSKH
jgi:hypothetical protein